jgi:hypothetical protein
MPNTPASDFGNSPQIGPLVGDRGHADEIAERPFECLLLALSRQLRWALGRGRQQDVSYRLCARRVDIELILTSGHLDVPERNSQRERVSIFSKPYRDREIVSALQKLLLKDANNRV